MQKREKKMTPKAMRKRTPSQRGNQNGGLRGDSDTPRRVEGREAKAVSNRWEAGQKIDIPEFHGGLKAEDFLDWLFAIEEVLEFKDVPKNKWVPHDLFSWKGCGMVAAIEGE